MARRPHTQCTTHTPCTFPRCSADSVHRVCHRWHDDTQVGNQYSALPPGLTDGVDAVALPGGTQQRDATYRGTTHGSAAELRAAINDKNNWVSSGPHTVHCPCAPCICSLGALLILCTVCGAGIGAGVPRALPYIVRRDCLCPAGLRCLVRRRPGEL